MRGHAIHYSATELAWIKRHASEPRRQAHLMFVRAFNRPDVSCDAFRHLCLRRGWKTGRTGYFEKGAIPANKGKKMPYNEHSARTRFKTGNIPHNARYLGHERVSRDGYVEISVAEVNLHTGYERRYVLKHKYLWERLHGPVPNGHVLKALDGNRRNTDPSNWTPINRRLLPLLNGHRGPHYDSADPEVKPLILTVAKLKRARHDRVAESGA